MARCALRYFSALSAPCWAGLWADDSWGRFWGWDPKENGALIIVLWNALTLHARWGKLVKERGLAVLAVAGNIAVTWSWFGVNELGVGLHSYGFTEGALRVAGDFCGVAVGDRRPGAVARKVVVEQPPPIGRTLIDRRLIATGIKACRRLLDILNASGARHLHHLR